MFFWAPGALFLKIRENYHANCLGSRAPSFQNDGLQSSSDLPPPPPLLWRPHTSLTVYATERVMLLRLAYENVLRCMKHEGCISRQKIIKFKLIYAENPHLELCFQMCCWKHLQYLLLSWDQQALQLHFITTIIKFKLT